MSPVSLEPISLPNVDLTPVQVHGQVYVKRDDLFEVHGVNGSKVMQALAILDSTQMGGIVGYGGRRSNTASAMAAAARERGAKCYFYAPHGPMTPELQLAVDLGADVRQIIPGYLSQCKAAAHVLASELAPRGIGALPVGLQYAVAVEAVAAQVRSLIEMHMEGRLPERVVVASGGYVLLSGVVLGLRAYDLPCEVLSVQVGGSPPPPDHYLGQFAHDPRVMHVKSELRYEETPPMWAIDAVREALAPESDLRLDPYYEAKCLPYLEPGDLLWNSGIRTSSRV